MQRVPRARPRGLQLRHSAVQRRAPGVAHQGGCQGADARLLTEENIEALNKVKLKTIHFAWDLMEQSEHVLRGLTLYQKYGRIRDHRRRIVYVLVNFGTTMQENLYRTYKLRELGYDPYVMVYNKTAATKEIRNLQRWCNNRIIFGKCK